MVDVGFFESFFEDININSWFNLVDIVIKIVICFLKYEGVLFYYGFVYMVMYLKVLFKRCIDLWVSVVLCY